jgi:chitin disaccharide deacetylase
LNQVFFRADDFGSCPSANRAILDCVDSGLIKNVGIMAPGAFLESDLEELSRSGACLGLHVTLNSEWETVKWRPCAELERIQSLLVDDHDFTRNPKDLFERGFRLEEAMHEVECQYQKLQLLGLTLTYLDEHMGVGWIPGLKNELYSFAEKHDLVTVDQHAIIKVPYQRDWTASKMINALHSGGTLQISHPAYRDEITLGFWHEGLEHGQIAGERDLEARWFSDLENVHQVFRSGIDSLSFSVLSSSRNST